MNTRIRKIRDLQEKANIDEKEIQKNIKNIIKGKPLTCPLAILKRVDNTFLKEYEETFNKIYEKKIKKEERKKRRENNQRPERKQWLKDYNQRPEVKRRRRKWAREYDKRPEIKERKKKYLQENKEKINKTRKKRYNAHKRLGLCVVCSRKAMNDRIYCSIHHKKNIEHQRKNRQNGRHRSIQPKIKRTK